MKVPVLTYHSAQVSGNDYPSNDHVALRDDLRTLHAAGFRIVPLSWVVDWLVDERPAADLSRAVALSFDDGCSLDFLDLVHPVWGPQRSFLGILTDFRDEIGTQAQPHLHATSFVVASPEARQDIGERCLVGPDWIADSWWKAASDSGLLGIENHSWDHNHPECRRVCQRQQHKGRFDLIETFAECEAEVRDAAQFIFSKTGRWPELFAYPWGQTSTYLRDVYFPGERERHRTRAAFSAHDGLVTRDSPVWVVPRLVFGANWTDPGQLRDILEEARSA